jgi:hypothetical protein
VQISELPAVYSGYTKGKNTIAIAYAEKGARSLYSLEEIQTGITEGDATFKDKHFQNVATVVEKLPSTDVFVVAISIENNYFKN